MAYAYTQTPPSLSNAESPIVFTTLDTTNVSKDQYQYVLKIKYWTGSYADEPAAFNYVLQKYPNASARGMFDLSKILNSLFIPAQADQSQMYNFRAYANYIYYTASTGAYVTGSDVVSSVYQAINGYTIFDSSSYVNQPANTETSWWPIMSSMPQTQSIYWCHYCGDTGDQGTLPILNFYNSANTASFTAYDYSGVTRSLDITFTSTNETGSTTTGITQVAAGIPNLNAISASFITTDTAYYTVQIKNNGVAVPSASIKYDVDFECKYSPVRIKFKNQFGQFDWFTFPKSNTTEFTVSENVYQPQIGSWEGTSLGVADYSTLRRRYYVDTTEGIAVNTTFIPESYNEWFKQMLVSNEIYLVKSDGSLTPLIVKTNSLTFKTQVNDKLINYTIEFLFGRSYKLII